MLGDPTARGILAMRLAAGAHGGGCVLRGPPLRSPLNRALCVPVFGAGPSRLAWVPGFKTGAVGLVVDVSDVGSITARRRYAVVLARKQGVMPLEAFFRPPARGEGAPIRKLHRGAWSERPIHA